MAMTELIAAIIVQGPPEPVMIKCERCGVPILSFWAPGNRGLLRGDYVPVADWLFHPDCYDAMTANFQPSDI